MKRSSYKKKHGEQAAEYTTSAFKWDGKQLTLAKMDAPLDIVWSRPMPSGCKPTTVTVTKDTAGRYFVSILVEEDIKPLPVVNKQVGLDLGLASMVVLSTGEAVGNPRFAARDEKKLAKAQRRLAKKKKGSKNRNKAQKIVVTHDRDHNAAKNVLAAGLAVSACGEAIRPGAVKAQPGKPQRNRKPSR